MFKIKKENWNGEGLICEYFGCYKNAEYSKFETQIEYIENAVTRDFNLLCEKHYQKELKEKSVDAYSALLPREVLKDIAKETYKDEKTLEYKIEFLTLMIEELYNQVAIFKENQNKINNTSRGD